VSSFGNIQASLILRSFLTKLQLFCKPLASLIFASFGRAQTSLALLSLTAKFGFERWLVGLANVLQCGWGFFLLFLRGEEKNKINFHQICTVLSKS
jgi:hypothetical protein